MQNEILDYDEYYTDEEQEIYEHGYERGVKAGAFIGMIGIAILTAVAIYIILNQ